MAITYIELNKTQKRVVDAFIELRPELAEASIITRPEIEEMFHAMLAAREDGGPKIGYPNWIVKEHKIGRGKYTFPGPKVTNDTFSAIESQQAQKLAEDQEFLEELKAAGINV